MGIGFGEKNKIIDYIYWATKRWVGMRQPSDTFCIMRIARRILLFSSFRGSLILFEFVLAFARPTAFSKGSRLERGRRGQARSIVVLYSRDIDERIPDAIPMRNTGAVETVYAVF